MYELGVSLRKGGVSLSPFDELNLGLHVGDDVKNVLSNRNILSQHLGLTSAPVWLDQIHSTNIISLDDHTITASADGSNTVKKNIACTIMRKITYPFYFAMQKAEDGKSTNIERDLEEPFIYSQDRTQYMHG